MNNGCLCCTVRGDLVRILGELKAEREKGEISFERVIIETTGMADPGPVAQTFFIDDEIGEYYLLDSVITVVDAKHAPKQLDEFSEAQEQVGFADRILLSKTDLVSDEDAETLRQRLGQINPRAPVKPVHFGQTPIDEILDIRGFNLNAILEIEPEFLEHDHHHHDDEVQSFVFRAERPLRRREARGVPVVDDPGLRQRPAALQGRAASEGQSAPRGVPGRAHADGRRPRPAVGRGGAPRVGHGVHRPQPPERRLSCKGWSNASSNHSEETGRAGRQARAPHRGAAPQDAGDGLHERGPARVLPRPAARR